MKQFFKFLFASFFGFLLGGLILVFILIGIIGGIASGGGGDEKTSELKDKSILQLNLNYIIPERTQNNPFEMFSIPGLDKGKALGLNDVLANIKKASENENIAGIYLGADVSPNSYATLEEIRNALIEFKKSGKFIISYAEIMDEHSYYVASVSDKIYLNPSGELLLNGFSQQVFYIKGMLDKIGLEPQLIRHGKYKAAGEPLIADKMSEANRKQIESYMGSLYHTFLKNLALSRKIELANMTSIVNELKVQSGKDAVKLKLVDGLKYQDEVEAELKGKMGTEDKKKLPLIGMAKFRKVSGNTSTSDNKIAVVYCVGDIVGGEGDDQTMGSDRIAATIKKVREDDSYKALVLRINSPGGSALASDVIWREVVLCKAKKPVVVSMGSVAASGGYYIAAPADAIVAEPNTITGSIGVFGLLMNAKELLNNKLGIKIETVKFGEFSDLGSPDRPLNEAERKVIQNAIDRVYADFVQRVAEGRKLTEAQVDSIAQGRVWSGEDAKSIGLVDELGGLDKAIAIAVKKADLSEYRTVSLPDLKDPFEEIFSSLSDQASAYFMNRELGVHFYEYEQVKKAIQYQGIQVRMPFTVDVE
ncbi:MAG: signal peptide peptidase SppA [Bacteroidia bacterium]|nr:signal peptide peptidase SppA [Bacteroidia bacterium]MCF8446966.1 signal peptide peptidase SppA [Bacteroidia bacterium]